MKNYKQLEKLFGRELFVEDLSVLAKVFGFDSIDSLLNSTKELSIQPLNNMPMKSVFSDKELNSSEFEYHWQKLSNSRRRTLNDKLQDKGFAPGHDKQAEKLGALTGLIGDTMGEKIVEDLYDAIVDQEHAVTHLHYNKGYLDGIKFSLMMGQL